MPEEEIGAYQTEFDGTDAPFVPSVSIVTSNAVNVA